LPHLVEACVDQWELTFVDTFASSFSYVARVVRSDGTHAVLKLTLDDGVEREALARWAGDGAVLALESDPKRSALLLELLEPGEPLSDRPLDESLAVMLELGARLWVELEGSHPFRPLADVLAEVIPLSEGDYARAPHACDRALLDEALATYASPQPENRLLHGDFHSGNVRSSRRQPWLAIDPGAAAGERAHDLGWLLLDAPRAGAPLPSAGELERRLALLASESGVSADRIRAWAVARGTVTGVFAVAMGLNSTASHMFGFVDLLRA
jgi:streptomycin 6-kinase